MRRRLPGVALRLEGAAIIGDHVALVVHGLWHPQLDERQLAGRPLLTARSWLPCSLLFDLVLKVRDSPRQNIHDELVFSGDSLPDALVDVVKRVTCGVSSLRSRGRSCSLTWLITVCPALLRI